jgi:cobalamin transport system substrate-binding protein
VATARRGLRARIAAAAAGVAFVAAAAATACRREAPSAAPPASAAAAVPRRVVSLAPSMTETLVALGLGDRLVGVSDYCPDVKSDPPPARVGGLNNLNVEAVLALRPDLVMTVQNREDRSLLALKNHGVELLASDPETLDAVFASIASVGERFGRGDAARALVRSLRERLARVADAAAKLPRRPKVFLEVDYPPPWTIGRGSFVRDAVLAAGADNLFDDLASAYPTVDPEAILARDPDWIVLLHPIDTPLAQRGGFATLRAVREGRVVTDLDRDALLHSSPRLVDGIEALAARLGVVAASPASGATTPDRSK